MADWGQKAKDKDRDDAVKVIEDAAARGQIVDVDKLKRIQEVQAAGTVGEIELVTRGLAAAPAVVASDVPASPPPVSDPAPPANPTFQQYTPPVTPPVTEPDPTPPMPPSTVQYGEPLTSSGGTPVTPPMITKSGGAGKWVLLVVLIVVAGVAVPVFFGIKAIVDTVNDGIDDLKPGGADVFTEQGLDALTDDIEDATGSTEVFSVVLYPEYAVVTTPADRSSKRYINYYWDGNLSESSKGSGIYDGRFDMRDIKAKVVKDLLDKARQLVEGPTSNYVVIRAPGSDGASINAYASNDFSESGYLTADFDGKVIAEHPPS